MVRTVLSNEAHLFNQDERLIFSRYGKLSCESRLCLPVAPNLSDLVAADARHILIRLCTRKPEKWFRLKDLDNYRKHFGDRIPDIIDELCRDLVKPIVEGPEPESEVEVIDLIMDDDQDSSADSDAPVAQTVASPDPALPLAQQPPAAQGRAISAASINATPTVTVKAETVEVQVKTEDIPLAPVIVSVKVEAIDQECINPPNPSIPSSLCSDTAPKIEEQSQPGPSCLPPQAWEFVVVARDEEHASIEDLLNCLTVEELQSFVKSLKVKCASKKVGHLPR
jgi:hypothetical protein